MNKRVLIYGAVAFFFVVIAAADSGSTPTNPTPSPLPSSPALNQVPSQRYSFTAYTASIANLRSCASTSCRIVGQYPAGSSFTMNYDSMASLPEWLPIGESSANIRGYMHKSVFSLTKPMPTPAPQVYYYPSYYRGGGSSGGSGHTTGYEWAENNDIQDPGDCGGNSNSFIEGCEEYADEYRQQYYEDNGADDYYDEFGEQYEE